MKFNIKQVGPKSPRDESLKKLLNSPAIMAGSLLNTSGSKPRTQNMKESKTIFLPSDPNELCDILKLVQQKKQNGNNSDLINEEIFVILDKLLKNNAYLRNNLSNFYLNINLLQKQV